MRCMNWPFSLKSEESKMKTYKTSEVAKIVGLHPNTIRRYEEWELIPIPPRAENGYRVFTDYHIETIKIAQIAFQIEVLQSGLRMTMVEMVKAVARYDFEKAQSLFSEKLGTKWTAGNQKKEE